MSDYFSIKQASEYLHVAQSTLRRWEYEGKIKPKRTSGGQRRYTKSMLDSLLVGSNVIVSQTGLIIGYCRVSAMSPNNDLKRQQKIVTNFCEMQGLPFKIISDVGSGLDYNRKGFKELVHAICQHDCNIVVVNYQDRLVRYGFDLLKMICQEHQVKVVIINQTSSIETKVELVKDTLSTIDNVAVEIYGKGSNKYEEISQKGSTLFA